MQRERNTGLMTWCVARVAGAAVACSAGICRAQATAPAAAAAVQADKLYRNRDNLSYRKKWGIRLSGPPLGRPKRDPAQDKRIERMDAAERNEIEGGFGTGKRRYGLDRIMAKLRQTAETAIALPFLVMNLDYRVRVSFAFLLRWALGRILMLISACQVLFVRPIPLLRGC